MINTHKLHEVHISNGVTETSKLIEVLWNVNQQNAHFLNWCVNSSKLIKELNVSILLVIITQLSQCTVHNTQQR